MITSGFGLTMDLEKGTMRQWVMGSDGVKRWADNNEPVDGYPCAKCGKTRTKDEGGTTFTVCDACWEKAINESFSDSQGCY